MINFKPCDYSSLAHFIAYEDEDCCTRCGRMSYIRGEVYSYSTKVGVVLRDKKVLLLSSYKYSKTTSKMLWCLKQAFSHWEIIEVAGVSDITESFEGLTKHFASCRIKDCRLTRKKDREELTEYIRNLELCLKHHLGKRSVLEKELRELKKLQEGSKGKIAEDYIKKEKRRLKERERFLKIKDSLCKRKNKMEVLVSLTKPFKVRGKELSFREKRILLDEILGGDGLCSYVFYDKDRELPIYTTKEISLPKEGILKLLEAFFKDPSSVLGRHIGPYTIDKVNSGFVCVGCHQIPVKNLEILKGALENDF